MGEPTFGTLYPPKGHIHFLSIGGMGKATEDERLVLESRKIRGVNRK